MGTTWGNLGATDREMKLCSSLLFSAAVTAQYADDAAADRWGNYDYVGGFTYPTEGKDDGGNSAGSDFSGDHRHVNGLYCWMCDERLDLGNEVETGSVQAYARCLNNGGVMKCTGEQRTCMFEERRRNGVVYSVCTGCKQTDACLALWRRNQRFTLPFMNFGDVSLAEHEDGKPIYVDDECTAYENTKDSQQAVHVRAGLSYAKFSYDTSSADQENGQMSQWESSCRWCCAAKTDRLCNVHGSDLNSNPFANQCSHTETTSTTAANLSSAFTTAAINPSFTGVTCQLSNSKYAGGSYKDKFRFFHPFALADTTLSYNAPTMWIDTFIKTAMADLMAGNSGNPVTGEGRNSVGMDKYKYRGNSYNNGGGKFPNHVFEHQSDMPSQENRDFFDARILNA